MRLPGPEPTGGPHTLLQAPSWISGGKEVGKGRGKARERGKKVQGKDRKEMRRRGKKRKGEGE